MEGQCKTAKTKDESRIYAAVDANISTLRADVKIASVVEKSVVKTTIIPSRVKVLLTK